MASVLNGFYLDYQEFNDGAIINRGYNTIKAGGRWAASWAGMWLGIKAGAILGVGNPFAIFGGAILGFTFAYYGDKLAEEFINNLYGRLE